MEKLNVSSYSPRPAWLSDEGLRTLEAGYLQPGECPRDLYLRVAYTAAKYLNRPDLQQDFFDVLYKSYIGLSTPVASNFGTTEAQSISCYAAVIQDSVDGIYKSLREAALLSKAGGGHGLYYGDIRPSGSPIGKNKGVSNSVITWAKQFDQCAATVSQSGVRRGSFAHYIPIEHPDAYDFLLAKDHLEGDPRNMLDSNIAFTITDNFMYKVLSGDKDAHRIWSKTLEMNLKVGTPYLLFIDNVNNQRSEAYKLHNLLIKTSNLCLTGDTLIATKQGSFPIKELVNKSVEIFDGKNWVANNSFSYQGKSQILKVELANGQIIKMTPEHRCLVHQNYSHIKNRKLLEIKASELKRDMWLTNAQEFASEGHINEPGAYLKGFLLGDGTHNAGKPLLTLYDTKFSCEEALIKSANEISIDFNSKKAIYTPSFTEAKEYFNDKYFGRSVKKSMKGLTVRKHQLINWSTVYKKQLPSTILQWDRKSRINFISGLFDADGTGKRHLQLSCIHEQFVKDVANVLFSLGYTPNIDNYFPEVSRSLFRVSLSSWDAYKLFKEGNFHRLKWEGKAPDRKNSQWRKIVNITLQENEEDVYCTAVPSTSYFALANGILTGNCSEILEYADPFHTFVCCLCSLNLSRWREWKDWRSQNTSKTVPELAVYLLDAVMTDFITRAAKEPGLANAVRSATKGRALGIGTMGLAFLYQKEGLPFHSNQSRELNIEIHKYIKDLTEKASRDMYVEFGGCEWSEGTGMRHSLLRATAPTRTNSVISGASSPGIEPSDSNSYTAKQAKGSFIRKNAELEALLERKGKNTYEVWDSILYHNGSVFHLDFLDINEKLLFATAREIDPEALIIQAAERTPYIDQGQSLNRFIHPNIPIKKFNDLIFKTWKSGIKSTYYTKSSSEQIINKVKDTAHIITKDDCPYCDKAKTLLSNLNISYTEYKLEDVKHFTWKTVPQIWVEGHFIGGYTDLAEFTKVNNSSYNNKQVVTNLSKEVLPSNSQQDCLACEA